MSNTTTSCFGGSEKPKTRKEALEREEAAVQAQVETETETETEPDTATLEGSETAKTNAVTDSTLVAALEALRLQPAADDTVKAINEISDFLNK